MNRWRCTICGYIYEPIEGDEGNGVPRGTPFEALPDGWECPRCGVGKDFFEEISEGGQCSSPPDVNRDSSGPDVRTEHS